jgi:DivIVA domain-containing protein
MPLTPEDIEGRRFETAKKGYDKAQVDRFLAQVAVQYRGALDTSAEEPDPVPEAPAATPGAGPSLNDIARSLAGPYDEASSDDFSRLGSEVATVLRTAHQSVSMLRRQAENEAAQIRHEADVYAKSVRSDADMYAIEQRRDAEVERKEAQRILQEAHEKADAKVADAQARAQAIAESAETVARAKSLEVVADARRRAEQAMSTERDIRNALLNVRGDVNDAIERLPASDDLASALDDSSTYVEPPPAPRVEASSGIRPYSRPSEAQDDAARLDLTEDTVLDLVGEDETAAAAAPPPEAEEDDLAAMVKDAVGRAVQNAMNRRDAGR